METGRVPRKSRVIRKKIRWEVDDLLIKEIAEIDGRIEVTCEDRVVRLNPSQSALFKKAVSAISDSPFAP